MKIGQEYGTTAAEAVSGKHRKESMDVGINDVINDVINSSDDVINFNSTERVAVKAILGDPRLSAAKLAKILGVKQRQAQRVIASLKKKAGLKRRGAHKNGEWYFDSTVV